MQDVPFLDNRSLNEADEYLLISIADKCETKWVLPTLMNFDATPKDYAYTLGGVANDESSTICLPVLVSNPVSCEQWPPNAEFSYNVQPRGLLVSADDCAINTTSLEVEPWTDPGATVAGACTDGYEIGTARIVIGASRIHSGVLRSVLKKIEGVQYLRGEDERTVLSCFVNIRPAIGFRQLTLRRTFKRLNDAMNIPNGVESEGKVSYTITGDRQSTCIPRTQDGTELKMTDFVSDAALATAAAASWQLLAENMLEDGYLETLMNTALASSEYLEDVLGSASGIALGMYWGRSSPASDLLDQLVVSGGLQSKLQVRVGPGQAWALVYCIPSTFSVVLLFYLLWTLNLGKSILRA